MNCCDQLNDSYTVKSIQDIPQLEGQLSVASTDISHHSALFRCDGCGKLWIVENLGKHSDKKIKIYKQK